jgi:hypothetical protein
MTKNLKMSVCGPLLPMIVGVLLLCPVRDLGAQQRMHRKDRVDRIERLKQMRLMEDLQLGEEESVRFMARRKEHEEKMRGLEEERDRILDDLAVSLEDKVGDEKIGTASDRVLETDRKMFEERKRYQDEMRKLLTPEKYARLLLFERDFQSQVRDAMRQSMGRRQSKFDH